MRATVTTRRFTVDEYYRMADAGIIAPGERVELIEGEIVRMAAIGSRHAACVDRLTHLLVRSVGDRARVRVQNPVRLSDLSEPEPDIAVVRARPGLYADAHPGPGDVLLIVEVADATLAFDREVKTSLYATAEISEYWLVDLPADEIEVYREPGEGRYRDVSRGRRGEALRPGAVPELAVRVEDILPPRSS